MIETKKCAFQYFSERKENTNTEIFLQHVWKWGLGNDRTWVRGARSFLLGWSFSFQLWISRTTLLPISQSLRMPERWKHTHVTFYSSLMADWSCSHNDARLRTPYLADACTSSRATAPLTLPRPSDTARSVNATQMTLEMHKLTKLAHVLLQGSVGRNRIVLGLAEKQRPRGSAARPRQRTPFSET